MTRLISKIPVVGKTWKRIRKGQLVGTLIEEVKLRFQYGSRVPEFVSLPNSGSKLFLDRSEPRGRGMLLDGAIGQPGLKQIWHHAIEKLNPDVVIDVGANYGEFVFGEKYQEGVRVIVVEANPSLRRWLDRSLDSHPNRNQIEVLTAIAAETSGRKQSFYIDPTSSGRSSAICRSSTTLKQDVSTISLDDIVMKTGSNTESVVFKIDVEGYESTVMSGMKAILETFRRSFGVIEFNSNLIDRTEVCAADFLKNLSDRFQIAAILKGKPFHVLKTSSLEELRALKGEHDIELDLALMSDPSMQDVLRISQV